MYQNRISLIGFTGKDAEARTTNNQTPYTVLSLATKSSYKDKKSGEYVSHTEWHRIVAWGKLGEFARTLKKGTHLLVEGELRSREYADKKHKDVQRRVWEVRADSILKLDRAEQALPEDQLDAGPAEDEEPSC
jgi:single-strand DNA-binding protein